MSIHRLLFLSAVAVFGVALSACDGDGDGGVDIVPTPTPGVVTITSDDGKLTLEIPRGAVDEGTEISVTSVPLEQLPEALQVLRGVGDGYRLEPEGLEFSESVAVSLELDADEIAEVQGEGGTAAVALVSLTADGEREVLGKPVTEVSLSEGTVVARGELSHLSYLSRTIGSLKVNLVRPEPPVGEVFTATLQVANIGEEAGVELRGAAGISLAFGAVSVEGARSFAGDVPFEVPREFQCSQPGSGRYGVEVSAVSVAEVEGTMLETRLTVVLEDAVECGEGQ